MAASREKMDFDVVIVGAGPAGLSAAVRLGQLNQQRPTPLSVCVVEKGAYVGAHLLAGAVLEIGALNELVPDWREKNPPLHTPVTHDQFLWLTQRRAWRLPVPALMRNQGNYIISLELLCQWLAQQAEALGIHIFPGFSASEIIFSPEGAVLGMRTHDQGSQPGIDLYAKQTILAEGCRGSLSEQVMRRFQLRAACDPQSYALGLKEIWAVDSPVYQPGLVVHTVGWPLDSRTYGGGFIYHFSKNKAALGFVVGLDYQNPYLDPFQELQRFKTHPHVRQLLNGGKCISYGVRSLNEGGLQAIPQLTFPGGLLIGCGAGFLNVGKIKGIHNAMRSGAAAAEAIAQAELTSGMVLSAYAQKIAESPIITELKQARNLRPGFHQGFWAGMAMAAVDQYLFRGRAPWTLHYHHSDYTQLRPAQDYTPIVYPKPDGVLTFDKLTQVSLTGVHHRESEPCHLILKDLKIPIDFNLKKFAGPEQRYCPAAVYEFVTMGDSVHLQINSTNCLHCKACDIKDPSQNIIWTVPEGGDGPRYTEM
jgi:electron-transferring-flavoprotein dehydrogenase